MIDLDGESPSASHNWKTLYWTIKTLKLREGRAKSCWEARKRMGSAGFAIVLVVLSTLKIKAIGSAAGV